MNSVDEFKKIAKLNNIPTDEIENVEQKLKNLGYNFEEKFTKNGISIIKALCANKNEANVIIDVENSDKLSALIDQDKLIILIDKNRIYDDMYTAYKEALKLKKADYMIFISQESKTADIEKQLVSGVQGAKNLEFVLYG